jgi:hypothetical protein
MKKSISYRQYASDCRRIAAKMNAQDQQILETMAKAWELRAQEAERLDDENARSKDKDGR